MDQKIKIGIRMHDMASGTIEERIALAGEIGYSCAHVALSKLMDGHVAAGIRMPDFAAHLKEEFARSGVELAILGCYLNPGTPDEKEWEKNFARYQAELRFAAMMGGCLVGTETGAPNKEYRPVPECRNEKAFALVARRFRMLTDYAQSVGAVLAIEPVVRHIIYDADCAKRLLREINSPNLKIIFDPVNLIDTFNYEKREEIFDRFMELVGEEIAAVHVKDFTPYKRYLRFCAPGKGIMDYSKIFSYLKREKPGIPVIMEETLPGNAKGAMECLQKVCDMCV